MTRTIFLTLIGGVLAFTAGIVTVQSWSKPIKPTLPKTEFSQQLVPPAPVITPDLEPSEVVFGNERLRIVSEEEHLKSEPLCYDINVRYPQIVGSDPPHIRSLNQRIRRFVVNHYQWAQNPSQADLRRYRTAPEHENLVDLDYQIVLATDSILSINFYSCDYMIGAAHSIIRSHVINYDLKSHRELKLADLFKPHSKYLKFIARYCTDELKLFEPIKPKAEMFASWNLTEKGIRFNFDPCSITGCADGPHEVTIPFSALMPFLKPFKVV